MRTLVLFIVLGCCLSSAQAADVRCGWLENPTPANWWLVDKDGEWTLSTQGSTQAKGMNLIPDLTEREFVPTNGNYGYACACLTTEVNLKQKRVTRILAARQLPLSRCRAAVAPVTVSGGQAAAQTLERADGYGL